MSESLYMYITGLDSHSCEALLSLTASLHKPLNKSRLKTPTRQPPNLNSAETTPRLKSKGNLGSMWSFPKRENLIILVVNEILSYKQKKLSTLYKGYLIPINIVKLVSKKKLSQSIRYFILLIINIHQHILSVP